MLEESSILKDKNYLILILFICCILFFQNQYLSQLNNQNQELINLNKEVLSIYQELLDSQLKYSEDIHYMRVAAETMEQQHKEIIEETEKLNELFFGQMY